MQSRLTKLWLRKQRTEFRRRAAAPGAGVDLKRFWARIHVLELPGTNIAWDLTDLSEGAAITTLRQRFGLPPAKVYRAQLKDGCPHCRKSWKQLDKVGTWHLLDCQQYLERSMRHGAVRSVLRQGLATLPIDTSIETPFPGFSTRSDMRVERPNSKEETDVVHFDFQVMNPNSASRNISPQNYLTPLLQSAENRKNSNYRLEIKALGKRAKFVAFIMSIHGGFGDAALGELDQLRELINRKFPHIDGRIWLRKVARGMVRAVLEYNHRMISHSLSGARDRSL